MNLCPVCDHRMRQEGGLLECPNCRLLLIKDQTKNSELLNIASKTRQGTAPYMRESQHTGYPKTATNRLFVAVSEKEALSRVSTATDRAMEIRRRKV